MDWLKKLTILQLNRLVQEVGFSKYLRQARDRTLQYSDEVLNDIHNYITGEMMQKIIIKELPNNDHFLSIPDINQK